MSVAATQLSPTVADHTRRQAVQQTLAMSRRSISALRRQPALVIPPLVFPLFFLALGTSSFSRASFPGGASYLEVAFAGSIMQGVLFGSTAGATALATDIENRFFDRLLASPTSRLSILFGRLAGAAAFGATQVTVFLVILLPFGLRIEAGPLGALTMIVSGGLIALAVGALMSSMALRTGSSEAVQGAFPLLFILLFFSSAFWPRQQMSGAYRTIADVNPISHLVEGLRALTIDGFSAGAVARAIGIPVLGGVAALVLALAELRRRVAAS
jgi:ABC-2 type transport system permease protein